MEPDPHDDYYARRQAAERFVTTGEVWVEERGAFMFRFIAPTRGDHWTFLIRRTALEALPGGEFDDPAEIFHRYRLQIYRAGKLRMAWADPTRQQDLEADEIRGNMSA